MIAFLIDFGSTYTKITALDLDREEVVGGAQARSTVDEDVIIGLKEALKILVGEGQLREEWKRSLKLACSSAAGGLRLVAVGLVPNLSVEAARRAALGAGAKLIGAYSHELCQEDITAIEEKGCDIVLLAGGTDGGNKDVILYNAEVLAQSHLSVPVVVAGNRTVSAKVKHILELAHKYVKVTENVLPDLETLNVEPARSAIRDIFINRLVRAKGLGKVARNIGGSIIMPTPMAVLKAARLLANGVKEEAGIGELVVVDVGGATTDVHSIAKGYPTQEGVSMKGLPEPYAKRTVEGDLGLRYNALSIVDVAGEEKVRQHMLCSELQGVDAETINVREEAARFSRSIGFIPRTNKELLIDIGLARSAVEIAIGRHVARLREIIMGTDVAYIQYGKDLTRVRHVIGVGGVFAYGRQPQKILEASLFDPKEPFSLRPKAANLYIDQRYILYGIGLLSDIEPAKALRIVKKYLKMVN